MIVIASTILPKREITVRIIAKSANSTFVGDIVGGIITSELLAPTTITYDRAYNARNV